MARKALSVSRLIEAGLSPDHALAIGVWGDDYLDNPDVDLERLARSIEVSNERPVTREALSKMGIHERENI